MKQFHSKARLGSDTTPATHGDLEIWGGRILELLLEYKKETRERFDSVDERLTRMQDAQTDLTLLLKSIDKKVSKKKY